LKQEQIDALLEQEINEKIRGDELIDTEISEEPNRSVSDAYKNLDLFQTPRDDLVFSGT
jgi:hypothetical protein